MKTSRIAIILLLFGFVFVGCETTDDSLVLQNNVSSLEIVPKLEHEEVVNSEIQTQEEEAVEEVVVLQPEVKQEEPFVYDPIIPGDGKSPIRLQLINSNEYVEADWSYPKYHEEVLLENGNIASRSGAWQVFDSGKDIELILNYNRNNQYYMIDGIGPKGYGVNKSDFRPYTVEELELLIGVTPLDDSVSIDKINFTK
jgi:hypothetical protein